MSQDQPHRYDPKDHIQRLEVAPRAEGILDQREVTIHSYQTTVPFDFGPLDAGLSSAWLAPQIRFGVFSRMASSSREALNVVLGLQDELAIRAYDYDHRRPLWYSWSNAIVDTVNLHYFRDEQGLLRFTTTGGGRRITDDRLHEFNTAFLRIPRAAVVKRQFDLERLRDLCFKRFTDRLYMVRFTDASAAEYRSIDHALFQSRKYIDPEAGRLSEIRTDKQVKIESFDSDIIVPGDELIASTQVRFFIRGSSGSLRLRFPKVTFKKQIKTPEEEAQVFYRLADATVSAILDDDYYTHQRRSLNELSVEMIFPEVVELAPFREVLSSAQARRQFLLEIDLSEQWPKWKPHLYAINELLPSEVVQADVREVLRELARRDPAMAVRLLAVCQNDALAHSVGALVAAALAGEFQASPLEARAQIEEQLLSWAIERESESWDVDAEGDEFGSMGLKWRIADISHDAMPAILWKLMGVIHARLKAASDDVGPLLRKYDWCITATKSLPGYHSRNTVAQRLVAEARVPRSVVAAGQVLKSPVSSVEALDEAVLNQFGLPLWPVLSAIRRDDRVEIRNDGIGSALAVRVHGASEVPNGDGRGGRVDLGPGERVSLPSPRECAAVEAHFTKFGQTCRVWLPVAEEASFTVALPYRSALPATITRQRLASRRRYRKEIDPEGCVVGSSPALLEVFEQIHHANLTDGPPAVLLLGEPGVGKTHFAELLHKSSTRAKEPFVVVNAGGGGGDINIQRGEWIGYGKNHGIHQIDKNGRPGHLMKAQRGSLFVDEFASFSSDLQVVFLSVLEKRSVQKVGGEDFVPDVRCVFATNADIDKAVAEGAIRRDLLDRIPVRIRIPPLRQRRGDILLLAKRFAGDHAIAPQCLFALLQYDWPGNVRELGSCVAAALARMRDSRGSGLDVACFEHPPGIMAAAGDFDEDGCRRELWKVADGIARDEGFEHGSGLQRRAGEILGVGEAQASKMYQAYGLNRTALA